MKTNWSRSTKYMLSKIVRNLLCYSEEEHVHSTWNLIFSLLSKSLSFFKIYRHIHFLLIFPHDFSTVMVLQIIAPLNIELTSLNRLFGSGFKDNCIMSKVLMGCFCEWTWMPLTQATIVAGPNMTILQNCNISFVWLTLSFLDTSACITFCPV